VAAGNRSFSVSVEGVVGVNGFDPWSAIGSSTPFRSWYGDWNFSPPTTTVNDGVLNINFSGTNAICQGIEIIPLSVSATATPTGTATATRTSTSTTTPIATATRTNTPVSTAAATNTPLPPTATSTSTATRTATPTGGAPITSRTLLRCGGTTNYLDQSGTTWRAESVSQLVAGTSIARNYTTAVAGTTDDALYQTQREGSSFGYAIPVPNGTYNVGLWYSELGYVATGNRSFSVSVEGVVGVNGFDPWNAIGSSTPFRSWYGDWNFSPPTTTVSDGILNINFSGTNAICQGIEIIPLSVSATATPTGTATQTAISTTAIATATATRTSTATTIPVATNTAVAPTATATRTATSTTVATNTVVAPTATATRTNTATPPAGSTATATPTRTATPTATFTSFPAEVESIGYNTTSGKLTSYASGSNSITYSYSTTSGNLQGATWASGLLGNTILSYTFQGSLPTEMSWSGNVVGRVGVTYNNNLEIVSQTVNGANSVALTYDRDGLLKTAGAATNTYLATNGLLSTIAVGSTTETFSYNTFGEITSHQVRYGTTTLYSNTVAYDKGSRITSETEVVQSSTNSRTYGYDLQDRLTSVAVNGGAATVMTYDDAGNRTSIGGVGALFDNQDRLLQNDATLLRYSYNNKGDLSAVRSSAGALVAEYDYDIMGSLNGAVLYNNPSARRYIYYLADAAGRRVGKKVGSTALLGQTATPEKRWLYQDGLHPVAELDSSGALLSRFVYGTRGNVPAYMVRSGVTYKIVADHLGSVRLVVNASTGVVSQRIEYDTWGNVVSDTNPGFQPFGFAGGLYDQDTKLVRFGARDYDPATGRWVTKDPIRFDGGINLYAYAANNPVNLVDSDGLAPTDFEEAWQKGMNDAIDLSYALAGGFIGGSGGLALAVVSSGPAAVFTAPELMLMGASAGFVGGYGLSAASRNYMCSTGTGGGALGKGAAGAAPKRVPSQALKAWDRIKNGGLTRLPGYKSRSFINKELLLPKSGNYREHDVLPTKAGRNRGQRRIVFDTGTGQAWYTNDHYKSFIPIN